MPSFFFWISYARRRLPQTSTLSIVPPSVVMTFRNLSRLGATVRSVGALFLRSYERGERVHLAMLSRGYTGTMPFTTAPATRATWSVALLPAVAAALLAASGYWVR